MQVAQTRLRFQSSAKDAESKAVVYRGTLDCIAKIYQREGAEGLYRGVETKLWHSTLISALMFLTVSIPKKEILCILKLYLSESN